MLMRALGRTGMKVAALCLGGQHVRLDDGPEGVGSGAGRIRRGRRQLHRHRGRLRPMGARQQGRRVGDGAGSLDGGAAESGRGDPGHHLVGQASNDRVLGDERPAAETQSWCRRAIRGPMSRTPRWRPSCALAEYRGGHLSVWSHTQGVYPLRTALANVLGIAQDAITVRHAHGAGCYGHNGADDVAVDAAVIALQIPDHCIRVQWRREEEFGFEPFGPAMHVTVRAALDDAGKTRGLDCGNLVGDACAAAEHRRQPADARGAAHAAAGSAADRSAGSQWRRWHAQCVPAVRLRGQARDASPGAARAGAHIGAAWARRAAERVRDRVLHR